MMNYLTIVSDEKLTRFRCKVSKRLIDSARYKTHNSISFSKRYPAFISRSRVCATLSCLRPALRERYADVKLIEIVHVRRDNRIEECPKCINWSNITRERDAVFHFAQCLLNRNVLFSDWDLKSVIRKENKYRNRAKRQAGCIVPSLKISF